MAIIDDVLEALQLFGIFWRRQEAMWASLCGLAFLAIASALAPEQRDCYHNPEANAEDCRVHGFLVVFFLRFWRVLGTNDKPLLSLATVVLAIFTYRLWRDSAAGVQESREMVRLMDRNSQAELRAYLVFLTLKLKDTTTATGVDLHVRVKFKNVGKTSAYKVQLFVDTRIASVPLPNNWIVGVAPRSDGKESVTTIPPTGWHKSTIDQWRVIPAAEVQWLENSKTEAMYLVATLFYHDAFSTTPRETQHCARIYWQGGNYKGCQITNQHNEAT